MPSSGEISSLQALLAVKSRLTTRRQIRERMDFRKLNFPTGPRLILRPAREAPGEQPPATQCLNSGQPPETLTLAQRKPLDGDRCHNPITFCRRIDLPFYESNGSGTRDIDAAALPSLLVADSSHGIAKLRRFAPPLLDPSTSTKDRKTLQLCLSQRRYNSAQERATASVPLC